jgi:predicted Fe-Mo cluster-binding NifX family protein
MNVCIPVTPDGSVGGGWGRAARVAVARVDAGRILGWTEVDVRWDVLHDEGPEGGHHARIARFLLDQGVQVVVAGHMGPPMAHMLERMGIAVHLDADGDARGAVLAAIGAR